jgi:hypothetical protein
MLLSLRAVAGSSPPERLRKFVEDVISRQPHISEQAIIKLVQSAQLAAIAQPCPPHSQEVHHLAVQGEWADCSGLVS